MSASAKEFVSWLGVFGIPSIFAMTVWCIKACLGFMTQLKILAQAQKAQMRSQLLAQFHKYEDAGYISEEDLEDWVNQHKAYLKLVGDNGVLDARRDKLLTMPNSPVN